MIAAMLKTILNVIAVVVRLSGRDCVFGTIVVVTLGQLEDLSRVVGLADERSLFLERLEN